MKKIIFASLFFASVYACAQGYTTGPYLNAGLGGAVFNVSDLFDDNSTNVYAITPRIGLGFIGDVTHSELPVFAGLEANANYYYLTNSTGNTNSLYGADAAAILGKQITSSVGLYGKLGVNVVTSSHSHDGSIGGPEAGLGLGFQVTPHVRLTAEGNVALDSLLVGVASVYGGLQYSF